MSEITVGRGHPVYAPIEFANLDLPGYLLDRPEERWVIEKEHQHGAGNFTPLAEFQYDLAMFAWKERGGVDPLN